MAAIIAVLGLLAVPAAAEAYSLSMKVAKRNARAFAQHVARAADDDGYSVGPCSRISSRQVNCDVDYYGERSSYSYDCTATIFVKLQRDGSITRGHKHKPDCDTY